MKGFNAPSGSAHEDIDFNNYTMRQRARMLYMAAPIATSAIKTNRTNVVGVGLRLKSRIDREVLGLSPDQAERWQKETEREFSLWASNKRACDAIRATRIQGDVINRFFVCRRYDKINGFYIPGFVCFECFLVQ